jgi:hypothetical protein
VLVAWKSGSRAAALHILALSVGRGHVIFSLLARSGGTGRRAGLKIRWPQGRVGSTPSSGTILLDEKYFADFLSFAPSDAFQKKEHWAELNRFNIGGALLRDNSEI